MQDSIRRRTPHGGRRPHGDVVGGRAAGLAGHRNGRRGRGASVLLLDGRPGGPGHHRRAWAVPAQPGRHALYRGAGRPVLDRLGVKVTAIADPPGGGMGRRGDARSAAARPGHRPSHPQPHAHDGGTARCPRVFTGAPHWKPATLADRSPPWFDELGLDGRRPGVPEMLRPHGHLRGRPGHGVRRPGRPAGASWRCRATSTTSTAAGRPCSTASARERAGRGRCGAAAAVRRRPRGWPGPGRRWPARATATAR